MSKTIWKFPITAGDIITIKMPLYAEILTIQNQFDETMMWALVDPKQIKETRYFEVFGTGHNVPDLDAKKERKYINTFQVHGGSLIFHLFELKRKIGIPVFPSDRQTSNMDTVLVSSAQR